MKSSDVLKIIDQADDLPTLSTVATKVVSVTTDTDTSVKEVADLIEKDVALSAKILQVINSPFYGFSRGITSVSEAVGLMGFNQVGNLALGISVMGSFPRAETSGFSFLDFWERSLANAVAAVKISATVKPDASHTIFTTALLQDIGTPLLVRYIPLLFGYCLAVSEERNIHIAIAEQEVLDANHTQVGGLLAERWSLPPAIAVPIQHHHFSEFGEELDPSVGKDMAAEVKIVNLSNLITAALYADEERQESQQELLTERATQLVEIDRSKIDEVLDSLPAEIEQAKSLFSSVQVTVEETPPKTPGKPVEETVSTKGKKRILVAEDSAATRIAISNMLKRMGYEVSIALNGEEAVELARKEHPELILLDVLMPIMDGIEALKEIRSDVRLRSTPVVMLTSVTDIRMVTEAIECGANDYIAKPFQVALLMERVERYIHARKIVGLRTN